MDSGELTKCDAPGGCSLRTSRWANRALFSLTVPISWLLIFNCLYFRTKSISGIDLCTTPVGLPVGGGNVAMLSSEWLYGLTTCAPLYLPKWSITLDHWQSPPLQLIFVTMVTQISHTSIRGVLVLSFFSRVQFCATPWTAARQAPLSVRVSRQE